MPIKRSDFQKAFCIAGPLEQKPTHTASPKPDSDADVAVLLVGAHKPFLDTKLKMSDAAYDILLDTGINISPLPVWLDEWEHPETYVNPALLANIAREGVRV
jgi:hypothetical protein